METILRWTEPPGPCDYGPGHLCRREYLLVGSIDPREYSACVVAGWRRFGRTLFRLHCEGEDACGAIRVDARRFRPDRSQRRCRKANEGTIGLRIGTPSVTPEKLALFDRHQAERSATRGWPPHEPGDVDGYLQTFVENPFESQEWCYYLGDTLVGVGYVDELAAGLSAIYFAHDPAHRDRSLGTWNVLSLIDRASALGVPHVYLGQYGAGCRSLAYKAKFRPYQTRGAGGRWRGDEAPGT